MNNNCEGLKILIENEKSRNSEILKHKIHFMHYKTFIYYLNNNIVFLLRSMCQFIKLIYSVFFSKINVFRIAIIYFYINNFIIGIYCSDDNDEEPISKKIKINESTQQENNTTKFNREFIGSMNYYFHTKLCVYNENTIVEKLCFSMGQLFANYYLSNNFNEKPNFNINIEELILSILKLDLYMETRCNNFDILNDFNIDDINEEYKDNELKSYNFIVIYEFITIFCGNIQVRNIDDIFLSEQFLKRNSVIDINSLLSELQNRGLLTLKTKTIEKLEYVFMFWVKLTSTNISEEEKNSFIKGKLFEKTIYFAHTQSISLKKHESIYPNYINNNYFSFTYANFLSLRNKEIINMFGIKTKIWNGSIIKNLLLSLHKNNESEISVQLISKRYDISEDMYKSYKILFDSIVEFIFFVKKISTKIQDGNDIIFGSYVYTPNIFQNNFLRKIKNIIKNFPELGFKGLDTNFTFIDEFLGQWEDKNIDRLLLNQEFEKRFCKRSYNYARKLIESPNLEIINLLYSLNENNSLFNNEKRDKYMEFIKSQIDFFLEKNINCMKLLVKKVLNNNLAEIVYNILKFFNYQEKKTLQHLEAFILYKIYTVYLYYFIFVRINDLIDILSITQLKEIWQNYFNRFVRDKVSNQEEKKVFETFFVCLHLLMKHFDVIVQKYSLSEKDNHTA